jgi:hypothetical protein
LSTVEACRDGISDHIPLALLCAASFHQLDAV